MGPLPWQDEKYCHSVWFHSKPFFVLKSHFCNGTYIIPFLSYPPSVAPPPIPLNLVKSLIAGIKNAPNPPYTKMREWVPRPISQIRVSRTLLTPESTFGIILRYCAICVKNQFWSVFGQNWIKIFILA